MQIEDFKRWHWILISLVIGSLMAFCWNLTPPDEKADGRGTSAFEFVGNLTRQKTGNGYAWIRQTLIYPPEERLDPTTGKIGYANYVTCSMLTPLPDGKYRYMIKHFTADIPFKIGNQPAKSETYSIKDYLAEMKSTFPSEVEYRYAWWAAPKMQYILWMGGAVLLIGGLWPSLVSLMIGAGLGGHKEKKDDYDLSRFGKSREPAKSAMPVKPAVTDADMQKLRDLEDQLESNVAGMQMTGGVAASGVTSAANAPVKVLSGGSEPAKTVAPTEPEEPREYTGEYYPVVKPHHHEETQKH
jgi:hypothetical protein